MVIVWKFGRPNFFFTFMCNPKLQKITTELLERKTLKDRPDLMNRMFQLKLIKMIKDINDGILGDVIAKIWVIKILEEKFTTLPSFDHPWCKSQDDIRRRIQLYGVCGIAELNFIA